MLLGFSLALKEKYLWGVISLATSVLIKQSGFCVLPVFFVYALKKRKAADLAVGGFSSLALAQILYFPFFPLNTLSLAFSHYWQSLRGELGYLVCNAFNFWAFIFGFEQRPADMNLAGLPAYVWGYFLFGLVLALILYRLWRKATKEALVRAAFLAGFAAFLFLPKMHERYFYTSAVFLAVLAGLNKKMLTAFMALSLIHQVNLYHFFWSPKIPFLITLFSNALVLKILILINLVIFAKLLLGYLKHEIA